MSRAALYDTIGATYTVTRRTDPRIAARIWAALGNARTVLNVGAGTGSYEPPARDVLAVVGCAWGIYDLVKYSPKTPPPSGKPRLPQFYGEK